MKPETKKALFVFLGLTFGLTISLSIIARLLGFTLIGTPALMSQMVVLAAMFITSTHICHPGDQHFHLCAFP